jgi:peptidylprolyl isomerase
MAAACPTPKIAIGTPYEMLMNRASACAVLLLLATAHADVSAPPPQKEPAPDGAGKLVTLPSGLQYVDLRIGSGPSPHTGDIVSTHYVGRLIDGKKFDSSLDRSMPFQHQFGVGQVIRGWEEGLATMRVGGRRRLIIPYTLAYGERGHPPVIPEKATLIFEIDLLAVKPHPLPSPDPRTVRP